jgi:hypothetical protein
MLYELTTAEIKILRAPTLIHLKQNNNKKEILLYFNKQSKKHKMK